MNNDSRRGSHPDAQQWIYAMRHTADGRYRVNVGVINPTAVPASFVMNMFDATGNSPGAGSSKSLDVPPFSMVQLLDPFASVNGGEWSTMKIRVECVTEGGGAFAYASVIDNATNDAYFLRAVKLMPPDEGP